MHATKPDPAEQAYREMDAMMRSDGTLSADTEVQRAARARWAEMLAPTTIARVYSAADSAQYRRGTLVYVSAADIRSDRWLVWAALRSDGSDGCYVYSCDLSDPIEFQRRADSRADLTVRP